MKNKLHPGDPSRVMGRTTAIALRALADAIQNAGVAVRLIDHAEGSAAKWDLANTVKDLADRMELKFISVRGNGKGDFIVVSNHIEP